MKTFSLNISYNFSQTQTQKPKLSISYPNNPLLQTNSYLIPCNPNENHPNIIKLEPRSFTTIPEEPNVLSQNSSQNNDFSIFQKSRTPSITASPVDEKNIIHIRNAFKKGQMKDFSDGSSNMMRQSRKIQKGLKKNKNLGNKKGKWSPEEDAQILALINELGPKWTDIADLIGGRTGKQVRERYLNALRSGINHNEWTEEEDKLFMSLCQKLGNRWCEIAAQLPGRTESQVKNRYYTQSRKQAKGLASENSDATSESLEDIKSYDSRFRSLLKPVRENSIDQLGSEMASSPSVIQRHSVDSFLKSGFDEDFGLNKVNASSHYDEIRWN